MLHDVCPTQTPTRPRNPLFRHRLHVRIIANRLFTNSSHFNSVILKFSQSIVRFHSVLCVFV